MTSSRLFFTVSRFSSSGCLTLVALALRSAASSVILRVKASACTARSKAFLNRAVAISSIVRVILRMLRIALRRLTKARVFAIGLPVSYLPVKLFAYTNLSDQFKNLFTTALESQVSKLFKGFDINLLIGLQHAHEIVSVLMLISIVPLGVGQCGEAEY